jgi:Leucine-rich repeat (LRR) protein
MLIGGGGFEGALPSETLQFLLLADCHLEILPPLGMYSNLLELSMSGNDLKMILSQQLAPLYQPHRPDLSGNEFSEGNSEEGCDCHLLVSGIADKNIVLQQDYKLNCISDGHRKTLL